MKTVVISFRSHKNLKSWLDYAGNAFKSEGELLALIVTKAAIEEASESKASRLLDSLFSKREVLGIGNTAVYAVRLPLSMAGLVRECAAKRGKSTSEWCAVVLLDWWQAFRELYDEFHGKGDTTWLARYAEKYRALVDSLGTVYAQNSKNRGLRT